MAFRIDSDGSIVISGFENGIADSPYLGISDMRSVNITSIPKEASVSFSTAVVSLPSVTGTFTADTGNNGIIPSSGVLATYQAVTFTTTGSLPAGLSAATIYWVGPGGIAGENHVYTDPALANIVTISGTGSGVQSFSTTNMAAPTYGTQDTSNGQYLIDSNGLAWQSVGAGASQIWRYMGNTTLTNANGNGIGFYQGSDGTGWLFVFRNKRIDYTKTSAISWVYGWTPASGSSNGDAMNTASGVNNPHYSLVGQDNVFYYTDANYLGSFFEKTGATFDPTSTATYTFAKQALLLPSVEIAQCLAELGVNLLVGGIRNAIYPWNRTATSFTYPILITENNIVRMVTANTNTYVFAGNRGRIYITNGSQAQLYKKVPDHLSGTVEPLYTWGDATYQKNQLYFGVSATTNSGITLSVYGGLWAIDLDTEALRMSNKLSYGTYAGLATVLIPIKSSVTASGSSMTTGWNSGASTFGVDTSISNPYTNSQSYVDSDLIPIGTFLLPNNLNYVEYKLNQPMVSGESITLQFRLKFSDSFTSFFTDTTVGNFSNFTKIAWANAQWLQIRAILNSTNSSPSYVRLVEIRLKGQLSQSSVIKPL